jgi:biopolymer transport protein ExbD
MAREHRRMMRDPRARARVSLSITPMIDVVFQLLIYFLLTAGFMGNERHLRAEMPPEQAEGARSRGLALEAEPLVIRVTRGGGGARIALDAGLAAPRDARELEQVLRDALVAPDRPRGLFTADHPIRIVATPDVPWEDVVEVFNAVVAAGYRSVAFGGAR